MERPLGITILAMLYILGGVVGAAAAAMLGMFSAMMADTMMAEFATFGGIITGVLVAIAALEFVIASCLLLGKSWSRKIVIVFVAIDLVLEFFSVFGGNMFGVAMLILDVFVLYYLYRPHVIRYFGETYKNCPHCGYIARDDIELHNHLITCEKK